MRSERPRARACWPSTPPGTARRRWSDISTGSPTEVSCSGRGGSSSMTTSHDAKTTTDHEEIRDWAQARGGKPASVRGTETGGEEAGVLRISFDSDSDLEEIGWEEFFDKFDEEN